VPVFIGYGEVTVLPTSAAATGSYGSWLRAKRALISQKIKLADAIRYALSRRQGPTRFIDDGWIGLDNLSRKNVLFARSDGGAEHWAVIASLIETCNVNDVDPLAYSPTS
jgi:hypothetical protein